jgi:hypothetical protein
MRKAEAVVLVVVLFITTVVSLIQPVFAGTVYDSSLTVNVDDSAGKD